MSSQPGPAGPPAEPSPFAQAIALHRQGRLVEAEALYRQGLELAPGDVSALHNLGVILKGRGETPAALALWRRALDQDPSQPHILVAMGRVHWAEGRPQEALDCFDAALALQPNDADAHNSRGNALRGLRRFRDAVAAYDQALELKPDLAMALSNRGHALNALGQPEAAIDSYRRALALAPEGDEAWGAVFEQQLHICDWTDYEATRQVIDARIAAGRAASLPFGYLLHSTSATAQLACARIHVRDRFRHPPAPLWTGQNYGHQRIRLGYVSSDYRAHAVAHLVAELFARHDRSRFEVVGFALAPTSDDAMRRRIAGSFDRFEDVAGLSEAAIAQRIREAEIDIAIDLNGFTTHCRPGAFARRPAPIQVNYLGYPATMGAGFMDYILGDPQVIPPGGEGGYDEAVVRLPHSYQVNDPHREIAQETPSRAEVGLPDDAFVFCCFNANQKFNPPVFEVWMRLLRRVEGSVLWLFQSNDLVGRNLRAEATRRGVDPARLVFAPRMGSPGHLARHRLADLFLDTFPYTAHTTGSDALWAGLPIVTCAGETFASRVGASLLHAVGLPDLVTETLEAYEALAFALATDPDRLAALRLRLAANRPMAPLFDIDRSRRAIEQAYLRIWDRHRSGQRPLGFDVADC